MSDDPAEASAAAEKILEKMKEEKAAKEAEDEAKKAEEPDDDDELVSRKTEIDFFTFWNGTWLADGQNRFRFLPKDLTDSAFLTRFRFVNFRRFWPVRL